MAIKIGMASLGCPKNQVDAEIMLATLENAGYELVADENEAEVIIVNTCGFIESAKQESIDTILDLASLKDEGNLKKIIVTGCLAQRYSNDLAENIPECDGIVCLGKNGDIVDVIQKVLADEQKVFEAPVCDMPLDGDRVLCNEPYFAYLKISEGCNNRCTYCAIPGIRGEMRSRPMEEIVAEAKVLANRGVKELVVVAQDTTRYGEDIYGALMLPELLQKLCEIENIKWIRILYAYPNRITDKLIEVIRDNEKIVKYLDMPIQHCNGDVLKSMNRPGNKEELTTLIKKIRKEIPDIVLRSTVMVGFPTEGEKEFEELCEFVKDIRFERLGCFAYSPEEDTPAAEMEQLDEEICINRQEILMSQQTLIAESIAEEMSGKRLDVLVEGYDTYIKHFYGRCYMDAPDVDCKVFFTAKGKKQVGEFVKVEITDTLDLDLLGKECD
ncbi:MAG: 30S ribosomal protein S12 methylthiotransferase RimO [Clostridia bacterium]|nr:30S ribosomal protein S12 methylthiotransferase RimO [Clostridia bacterium]